MEILKEKKNVKLITCGVVSAIIFVIGLIVVALNHNDNQGAFITGCIFFAFGFLGVTIFPICYLIS